MIASSWSDVGMDSGLRVAWEDGDRIFCRGWRRDADGNRNTVLVVRPAAEQPTSDGLNRFTHEYGLKDDLVLTQKIAAQALPVVGALGGAAVNYAFIDHFQDVARGHFTVRRLERLYGKERIRSEYDLIAAQL
jgi:hypothetical protein